MNEQANSQERIHLHVRKLVATALNQSELIGLAGMLRVIAEAVDAYGCILWEVAPDVDWDEGPPQGRLFVVAEWFEGGKNFIRGELPLHSSANGKAILTGEVINISDPQHDPRVFHGNDFLIEAGIQAMCAIPIPFRQQVEGRVGKGAVTLYRKDALTFTDLEIECARRLIALVPDLYQAVQDKFCQTLLREVNDLLHEADGNAAKSPLPKVEVQEVLQKICILLAKRLRCAETAILLEDRFEAPGVFQYLASVSSAANKSTKLDRFIGETGLADWVLTHARPVRIFDLAATDEDEQDRLQRDYPGLQLQNVSELKETIRKILQLAPDTPLPPLSVAAVPIVWGDELIGVLRYSITEVGPFFLADRELKLIEEIAQRISRFWRNWQLRREVEAENYSWQGLVESVCNLNDFAQRELTNHQPTENRIFTETLRVIENVIRGTDATDIRLLDKQANELYIAKAHGKAWNKGTIAERQARLNQRYPVSEEGPPTSASGHVYQTREVYFIPDIFSNPYYSQPGHTILGTKRLILAPICVGEHFYGVLDIRGTGNIEFPNYACAMAKLLGRQLGLYRHLAITMRDLIAAQTAMENQARVQTQVYQDLAHQLKSPITQAHARSQYALTGQIQDRAFQENLQSLRSLCSRAKRVTLSLQPFN
jgi:transcriptional regulator with GAF, ATPase, and Fis domain